MKKYFLSLILLLLSLGICMAEPTGALKGYYPASGTFKLLTVDTPTADVPAYPFSYPVGTALGFYPASGTYHPLIVDVDGKLAVDAGGGGAIASLSDVLLSGLANGEILTYNLAAGKWENSSPGAASAFPVADLTDVAFSSLTGSDTLVYDATNSLWINTPLPEDTGEVNTASNLGAGEGLYSGKSGYDLRFKSLIAGNGVTLTSTDTETITITMDDVAVDTATITAAIEANTTAIATNASDIASNVIDIGILYASSGGGSSPWTVNDTGVISASSPVSIEGDIVATGSFSFKSVENGGQIKLRESDGYTFNSGISFHRSKNAYIYANSGGGLSFSGAGVSDATFSLGDGQLRIYGKVVIPSVGSYFSCYSSADPSLACYNGYNDTDTGMYFPAADECAITAGGVQQMRVTSRGLNIRSNPPATAASTGVAGDITWDADYIYICVSADTWKRVAIATW